MTRLLIITIAVGAMGLLIAVIALFRDAVRQRGRERRRCPGCWYDMRQSPSLVCPECGHDARSERRLRKFRRRWKPAIIGLLIALIASVVYIDRRYHPVDWIAVAPSWVLLQFVDEMPLPTRVQVFGSYTDPPPPWTVADELWQRYEAGDLSVSQRAAVIERQFEAGTCATLLFTRDAWPAGVPVWLHVDATIGGPFARHLRVQPTFDGGRAVTLRASGWHDDQRDFADIGIPPADAKGLTVELELTEGGSIVWSGSETLEIELVDEVDDVMTPVTDERLTGRIRRALEETLQISPHARLVSFIVPRIPDATLAFTIEVLRGDEVVAIADAFRMAGSSLPSDGYLGEDVPQYLDLRGELNRLPDEFVDGDWSLRVRADGAAALRDLHSERYWAGSFSFPVEPRHWE